MKNLLLAALFIFSTAALPESLESRVETLERQMKALTGGSPTARPAPAGKSAWRQLQMGMSQDQVESLLGVPGKITRVAGETWMYYDYPSGGKVELDRSGNVYGWSEP